MRRIENIWHWVLGLSINIVLDFCIMLCGIFSKEVRKDYIQRFYPHLLQEEQENE